MNVVIGNEKYKYYKQIKYFLLLIEIVVKDCNLIFGEKLMIVFVTNNLKKVTIYIEGLMLYHNQ